MYNGLTQTSEDCGAHGSGQQKHGIPQSQLAPARRSRSLGVE